MGYHGATSCGRAHRAIFSIEFDEFLYDFMNISINFINSITFTVFLIVTPTVYVHSILKLITSAFFSGGPPSPSLRIINRTVL